MKREHTEAETIRKVHELFGEEPGITIDASGAQASIRLAILVSFTFYLVRLVLLVDRTGLIDTLYMYFQATKAGGVAVFVGMGAPEVQIPLIHALIREIDLRGVFRYANEYVLRVPFCTSPMHFTCFCPYTISSYSYASGRAFTYTRIFHSLPVQIHTSILFFWFCSYADALDLVASGKINVKPLITHNFKLEETVKAFDTSKSGQDGVIKVMIHCN